MPTTIQNEDFQLLGKNHTPLHRLEAVYIETDEQFEDAVNLLRFHHDQAKIKREPFLLMEIWNEAVCTRERKYQKHVFKNGDLP